MQKIDISLKKYFQLTLPTTIFILLFTSNIIQFVSICVVYIASMINLMFWVQAGNIIFEETDSSGLQEIFIELIIKNIFLFGSFFFAGYLLEEKIVLPLFNYIFHIILLSLYIAKKSVKPSLYS